MNTLPKFSIPSTFLVVMALCLRPACGGSSGAVQDTRPPAAPETPAALPPETAPSSYPRARMLTRPSRPVTDDLRGAVPVLVIPAQEMTPETYDRIVDDLNIMNRILEKSVTEAPGPHAYDALRRESATLQMLQHTGYMSPWQGDKWILRSSSGRAKPLFIGGYGAVFSLTVNFPLLPPPEAPEPNKASDKIDPTWAQAQRELQDPQATLRLQQGASQGRAYHAEAVESLRSTLIGLLKHGTNIRDLGPQDWLTILVQGPSPTPQDGAPGAGAAYGSASPYGRQERLLVLPGTRSEGRTLLTLRARKADIDQYAKGQLDETQFHQRVQIVTH